MATSSALFPFASKSAILPREELANPSLPTEIITDIFSRLPAIFVFQMECLSKHYSCSLSKDPHFVEAYFRRHSIRFRLSLLVKRPDGDSLIRSDGSKIREEKVTFPPRIEDELASILASYDGILLLCFHPECKVWYPATDTLISLPCPSLSGGRRLNRRKGFWGFGYCTRSRDHKVVKIASYKYNGQRKFVPLVIGVKTDSHWRRVDLISGFETCSGPGISLNGVIYWKPIKHEGKYKILTFVLAEDKFMWISCPEFHARSMEKLWFLKYHWPLVPADVFKIHAFLEY